MIVFQKKKRSLSSLCFQLQNKKSVRFEFSNGRNKLFFSIEHEKKIVCKYNFKTWMSAFDILYDEKCLIWGTDKILMFEVLPKSRL